MNKHIILLFIILCIGLTKASAQHSITGKVLDATNQEPIPFASVTIKNVKSGTTTDNNGNFTLKVNNNDILIVSFMGYETKEVNIGTQKKVTILLSESSVLLDAVVVTGFQNLKKTTFTGSSVKIKADDINLPGETDISRMLEGKAAGVSIQNVSSTFGSAPKIRVRGATSINGENKPLWVVDGIVLEDVVNVSNDQLASGDPTTLLGSSVAGINTNDIETIDVLKDAAATALYGARAMNGVVVITTKRGKEGKPRIHYSGNYTVRTKPRYSEFNIMNSADQMSVYAEMERKGLLTSDIVNNQSSGIYGIMYNRINTWDESKQQYLLENTYAARHNFLMEHAAANTDWFDLLFTNSIMNEHTLSVSSGSQKSKSYISLGFLNDPGWTVADKVNRITMNFRNDYQLNDKIGFSFQTVGSVRMQNAPGSLSRSSDVVSGISSRNFDINPFNYALNTSRALRAYDSNGEREYYTLNFAPFNILEELDNNYIKLNVIDLKAQAEFNWQIIKGLTFKTAGTYNTTDSRTDIFYKTGSKEAYRNGEKPYGRTQMGRDVRWTNYNNLTWKQKIKKHTYDVMLGHEVSFKSSEYLLGEAMDFPFDNLGNDNLGIGATPSKVSSSYSDKMLLSFFARGNYNYDNRYLLTATIRADGSTVFSQKNKWGYFPSFSAAWRVSEEAFMKDIKWLSNFKVRFGWGTVGNDRISNYLSLDLYEASKYGVGNNTVTVLTPKQLKNANLKWEGSNTVNLGVDLGFFDSRLNITADFFIKNTKDLLLAQSLAHITGFNSQMQNIGKIQNKGFELNVNSINIQTRDFTWNTNFNISFIKNTLKSLASGVDAMYARSGFDSNFTAYDYIAKVGESLGLIYGYEFDGIYQSSDFYTKPGDPTLYLKDGVVNDPRYSTKEPLRPGVVKYKDQDGDGKITTKDRTVIGSAIPKWYGGITNTLNYKGIDFSFMLQFNYGNDVYNATRLYSTQSRSGRRNMLAEVADRWSPTNASNKVPLYNGYITNDVYSRFVEDGSFLRLKNITLGYTLPKKWTSKFYVSRLRVYATGQNLFCVTGYSGYDPEVSTAGSNPMTPGLDWGAYPKSKVFTFGLDIQF